MKRASLLLVLIFLVFCPGRSVGNKPDALMLNPEFIEDAQIAIDLAYNRQYRESVIYMKEWRDAYPDNPLWSFWPALNTWWYIISDLHDTQYDQQFTRITEQAISYSDQMLSANPRDVDAMIVKSVSMAFLGRLQSNREQWLRSFRNARRSVSIVGDIEKIAPDHPDLNFANGMILYFSAFLKDEYAAARAFSFLMPKGDREKGLSILDTVADNGIFFAPEATYFLGHIYLHYERDYNTALTYILDLTEKYPDNPYYGRLLARTYFRNNRFELAKTIIDDYLRKLEGFSGQEYITMREELYLLKGRIYQNNEQFEIALSNFELSMDESSKLSNPDNRRFRLMSAFHKGESHLRLNEQEDAKREFEFVASANTDFHYVQRARNALNEL